MKFTSNTKTGFVARAGMALALTGMGGNMLASAGTPVPQAALIEQKSNTASAVAQARASDSAGSRPQHYQKAHWYNNEHWWKRNAPIIGGAGGGALIGGLAGGGSGALIGGAAGGGGGYLYKRMRRKHHHPHD